MRVYVDSVGCRLNQSEIEKIAARFHEKGYVLVDKLEDADLVVINTCAVTGKAVADSRSLIRHAAMHKDVRIIATGCWAELEPQEICKLPGNIQVIGNRDKASIADLFGSNTQPIICSGRQPVPGERFRTRAFIKVQDGCDHHCTFCVTRIARGKAISRPVVDVLQDIQWAEAGGTKEVVLTGVNLSSWGEDFEVNLTLTDLVKTILDQTSIPRLRLSSVEPWNLDEEFFDLWHDARMCRHIHLPLQSGSDVILKRMGRHTTKEQFIALVDRARDVVPDMAISTDIIVGFPGEEIEYFEESLQFVQEMRFERGHVFAYSARPGTPAASLPGRVHPLEIKRRSERMRAIFAKQGHTYREKFIGAELDVLWESSTCLEEDVWRLRGLSDNYLKVICLSHADRWNQIDRVRINGLEQDSLIGELI